MVSRVRIFGIGDFPMRPATHHIPFLDYFRGVAILSVFIYHCLCASYPENALAWNGWFRSTNVPHSFYALYPAAFGYVGVPIFFAISGFCIHLSHHRLGGDSIWSFFHRRFFRIYPPYLVALCFFAFVFYPTRFAANITDFVSHLFLIHNFSTSYCFGNINPSFWSIAIEAQLYLLYPVLLWLRKNLGWTGALWLVGLIEFSLHGAVSVASISHPSAEMSRFVAYSPFTFWFSWSIGAALASAYLEDAPIPFRHRLCWIFPIALVACYFVRPLDAFSFPFAALCSVSLMAYGLGRSNPRIDFLATGNIAVQHLRWAGVVSYSAYLIHQPLLDVVPGIVQARFAPHAAPHLVVFASCLLSWLPIFVLSYFCYQRVELPSIAWGKNMTRRSTLHGSPVAEKVLRPAAAPIILKRKMPASWTAPATIVESGDLKLPEASRPTTKPTVE